MNNKGQSLVIFIIFIPVIIVILGIVIDIGLMGLDKIKTTNTLKNDIEYCLNNNCDEETLKQLISKNIKYKKIDISMDNNIKIDITYQTNTVFTLFNNQINYKITGFKDNEKIRYKEG